MRHVAGLDPALGLVEVTGDLDAGRARERAGRRGTVRWRSDSWRWATSSWVRLAPCSSWRASTHSAEFSSGAPSAPSRPSVTASPMSLVAVEAAAALLDAAWRGPVALWRHGQVLCRPPHAAWRATANRCWPASASPPNTPSTTSSGAPRARPVARRGVRDDPRPRRRDPRWTRAASLPPAFAAPRRRTGRRSSGPARLCLSHFLITRFPLDERPGKDRRSDRSGRARDQDAHRRRAHRRRLGQDVRQRQPRHRGGPRARSPTRRAPRWHRAIDAARRAFDETAWSTDRELRTALPLPAAGRARVRARGAARGAHPRGGLPAHDHPRQPARHPAGGRAALPHQADRRVRVADRRCPRRRPPRHAQHPPDLEGAGRRRRRHRAVELPPRGHAQQARTGPGHRQHRDPQTGARHAVERHAARAVWWPSRPTSPPACSTW